MSHRFFEPDMTIDRDREKRVWEAAAPAWGRWADAMSGMADKLNQHLIDAVAPNPDALPKTARVLDLASGAGEPALSIARHLGPETLVVATDLTAGMLTAARTRTGACSGITFAGADMTALPFTDAAFDAVTCRFGVMFVPDIAQALREIARVLRPGGRAALMVWGPLSDNVLFAVLADTVNRALGPPSEDGDSGIDGLFRFAEPGSLGQVMTAVGFTSVSEREIKATRNAPATEPFWRSALEMSFGHRVAGLSHDQRAAVETAISDAFVSSALTLEGARVVPLPLRVRVIAGQI